MIKLILICGSTWLCFQLLVVLFGWRLTKLRGVAVVEWQEEVLFGEPDAVDAHLADQPDEVLRPGDVGEAYAVDFLAWENEFKEPAE